MSLSRIISEINRDFGRKSEKKFLAPVFNAPTEGSPLEFCNGGEAQKPTMMPYQGFKKMS